MIDNNFVDHIGSDGSQLWDRGARFGYTHTGHAENACPSANSSHLATTMAIQYGSISMQNAATATNAANNQGRSQTQTKG